MPMYIRPVYVGARLASLALCVTNGPPITDAQVLEHFDPATPGQDIKKAAAEFFPATLAACGGTVSWGDVLNVDPCPGGGSNEK